MPLIMEPTDVGVQPPVTIKVEEDQEVSDVKGCYIWLSENTQPNFLDETGGGSKGGNRVKRRRCSVANCDNFLYKNNQSSEPRSITFHKFPRDDSTRAIWVELCNRADKFSAKSAYICSDHFKNDDYIKYGYNPNPLEKKAHRLRPGVIPSLNLPEISLNGSQLKNKTYKNNQDEPMGSHHEEKDEDETDSAILQSSYLNEDDLMESSQEEEEERDSSFTLPSSSSRDKEYPNLNSDISSDVITISSSEDDDTDIFSEAEGINKKTNEMQKRRLDLLKDKYYNLQCSLEKLKTDTSEEIKRLNNIIKNKEDEFSRELREVLSVFLKPEEVESVVEETVW